MIDFIKVFNEKIAAKNISWEVNALSTPNGDLYSLGSDSKLIGRIFELISFSVLQEIADENGYILQPSDQQTVYPDFTLMKSKSDKEKIAIDIKTTYRDYNASGIEKKNGFTLGSYASFMRNGTKNIMFDYSEYAKHYVIGFIYTRNDNADEGKKFSSDELNKIEVPYTDVKVFVQEKFKIAGEKPGSGNTENIGSIKTNRFDYFVDGEGPFSVLGNDTYEDYWKGYPKYRETNKDYTSLDEYFKFRIEIQNEDLTEKRRIYEYWKKTHSL